MQAKRGERIENVALAHCEEHRQRSGHLPVRNAAFVHNGKGCQRSGKADEIHLDKGKGAHSGEAKRLKQRGEPAYDDVQYAAHFQIFHDDEHNHHNWQQGIERYVDGGFPCRHNNADEVHLILNYCRKQG